MVARQGRDPNGWSLTADEAADLRVRFQALRAEIEKLRGEAEEAKRSWRCFHCGDVFIDEAAALLHFGPDAFEDSYPAACVDPLRQDEVERIKQVREAQDHAMRMQHEAEKADNDRALLASYKSEIGRYFGSCGGVISSTPHQAWLVHEAMIGRAESVESRLKACEEALREIAGVEPERPYNCDACGHVIGGVGTHDDSCPRRIARAALRPEESKETKL